MNNRTLIEVRLPAGGIGLIVEWSDLARMDWVQYLLPLAELVAATAPRAVWTFTPIPDDVSDKTAITGH